MNDIQCGFKIRTIGILQITSLYVHRLRRDCVCVCVLCFYAFYRPNVVSYNIKTEQKKNNLLHTNTSITPLNFCFIRVDGLKI